MIFSTSNFAIIFLIISDDNSHHNVMVRREAFGEWLKNAVEETVQRQIAEVENDDQKILHYLTGFVTFLIFYSLNNY